MRTHVTLGAIVALAFVTASPVEAQIWKRVQKKAEEAVKNKAEAKVDAKINEMATKMVDNSFNAMFGDIGGGESGGSAGAPRLPFKIGSDVKTEDRYSFDIKTVYEMESFEKGGKSDGKIEMTSFYSKDGQYTGTQIADPSKRDEGNAFIIFDLKNQAMLMLLSSDDGKFRMGYGWSEAEKYEAQATEAKKAEDVDWSTTDTWNGYTKIGSKEIAGYKADGYRTENEDGVAEVWVSHDKDLGYGGLFGANGSMKQMRGKLPDDYPIGMLLQVTSTAKEDGSRFVMTATEINRNANMTINMSEYPPVTMGGK